ncbi:hypothetical protein K1719_007817 [Acacia pycnantha]|nr:hypothetical protein K1719_007817 [Acacia pycnantha]
MSEKTMKSLSTLFLERINGYSKRERCLNTASMVPFVLTSLFIASIFVVLLLYSPNPLSTMSIRGGSVTVEEHFQKQEGLVSINSTSKPQKEQKSCDLFKGRWVAASRGPYYTSSSCTTIPDTKNCLKQGRKDTDFLNWKWKPEECELPRFYPKTFLDMVRGKKMAFIGDSVSRNHMESLLCLLSQEETPNDIYKDSEDRFRKWFFPEHNFTLMSLWSRFLIVGEERTVNGRGSSIFDMQLDKVDDDWAKQFSDLDYAIISDGHWFFRVLYLHEANKLIGCVYCHESNITHHDIDFPIRMAFRSVFRYMSNCDRRVAVLVRTFAPSHFENGAWNTGGYCNRTSPMREEEVDLESVEWKVRNVQIQEVERVRKEGLRIGELDVTKAMMMRGDGHPGEYWGNKWMKGYSDCTHWCMPGPIDVWNEFLLAVLTREPWL